MTIAAGYFHSVRDQPHWAILEACSLVRENKAGLNPSFCPTEPEFAESVRRLLSVYKSRLNSICEVLKAPVAKPSTPESRAKVAETAKLYLEEKSSVNDLEQHHKDNQKRRELTLFELTELHENRLRREYQVLGIEPPDPLVSLSTMISVGWSIVHMPDGSNKLAKGALPPLRRSMGG